MITMFPHCYANGGVYIHYQQYIAVAIGLKSKNGCNNGFVHC